jgi:hypothetical protein
MRLIVVSAAAFCAWPALGYAQAYPVPNELAVGVGIYRDHTLSGAAASLMVAFSWDYDENSRAALVVEGEALAPSEAEPCRDLPDDAPATCVDAALLGGIRIRRSPHRLSGTRPFAQILAGSYWKGSGVEGRDFSSNHFALQAGGGVEFRWAGSFQGLRMSVDFRHVFAGDRSRNQTRALFAYVLGPRRF